MYMTLEVINVPKKPVATVPTVATTIVLVLGILMKPALGDDAQKSESGKG